jgi:hypothetical protein
MRRWKLTVRSAVKVVAAIAGAVFFVANPLSTNWGTAFFISLRLQTSSGYENLDVL